MSGKTGKNGLPCGSNEGHIASLRNCDYSALDKGHKRLKRSMDCLAQSLSLIEKSWQHVNHKINIIQLMNMRKNITALEASIEGIDNAIIRAIGYDYIEKLATKRRFLLEEVRWELASSSKLT